MTTTRASLATGGPSSPHVPMTVTKPLLAADEPPRTGFAGPERRSPRTATPPNWPAELSTCRLRQYGQSSLTPATGEPSHLPHLPLVQPSPTDHTNPLYDAYDDIDRHFAPLTKAFSLPGRSHTARRPGTPGPPRRRPGLNATVTTGNPKTHPFRAAAAANATVTPRRRPGTETASRRSPPCLLSPAPLDPAHTDHRDVLATTLIPQIRSARSRTAGPPGGRERC